MNKRILFLAGVFATASAPASATETLYDQLGAQQGVSRIVDKALGLYFTDPRLHADFDNISRDWLQARFVTFICHVTDGPCAYGGRSMAAAHKGLHIDQRRFNAVVEDLQIAMTQAAVPFRIQNRLLARLAPMERAIVTQ